MAWIRSHKKSSGGGSSVIYERLCLVTYVGNDRTQIPVVSSINQGTNYSNYLSYDSTTGKFTVLQDFTGVITAWVYQYRRPSNTYSNGNFYINNACKLTFKTSTLDLGAKDGTVGIYDFKQGDTFFNYTPSSDGYPQQMLKIYKATNLNETDICLFDDENA